MINLEILAGAIPAQNLLTQALEANTKFSVRGVRCFDDDSITSVDDIKTVEQARSSSINLMDEKTKKRFYINLGTFLGLSCGEDETLYSRIANSSPVVFTTEIEIDKSVPLVENNKTIYPYRAYKGYQALVSDATKAYTKGVKDGTIDEEKVVNATRYLFSGAYTAELAKLRAGTKASIIDGSEPYHTITVK